MFANLARRLTTWYVLVAVVLLLAAVASTGSVAFTSYARSNEESMDLVERQAAALEPTYRAKHAALRDVEFDVLDRLKRTSLHLTSVLPIDRSVRQFQPSANVTAGGLVEPFVAPRGSGTIVIYRRPDARPSSIAGDAGPKDRVDPNAAPQSRTDSGQDRSLRALGQLLGMHARRIAFLDGYIFVDYDVERLRGLVLNYAAVTATLALVAALLAWLLGRYITHQALRPLRDVTDSLERFGSGDFTPRPIDVAGRNEFDALASAYNRAAAQVDAAFAEREAAERRMRQFVADAGHELRTPLTVVGGFLDVLRKRTPADADATLRIFDIIEVERKRMRVLIDNLVLLARLDRPQDAREIGIVDVAKIAEHVVESRRPLSPATTIRLFPAQSDDAYVIADESEIHEAVGNLVDNARKYAENAPIDVCVTVEPEVVRVEVADGGPGMSPEELAHAFERFYRGERRGEIEGSGLGLAIVKRATERANGTISLQSRDGHGTIATIELPRMRATEQPLET
jgi:two-component system OmpR family sensor kinase